MEFCFGIFPRITAIAKQLGTLSVSRDSSFFEPTNVGIFPSIKERGDLGMPFEYTKKFLERI